MILLRKQMNSDRLASRQQSCPAMRSVRSVPRTLQVFWWAVSIVIAAMSSVSTVFIGKLHTHTYCHGPFFRD
jgi:hypothetical protein